MRYRAALLALVLAAPAAFAQQDPSVGCMQSLREQPRFEAIKAKISLGRVRDSTFAMLADTTLPDEAERQAIAAWATARADCVRLGDDFRKSWPPQLASLAVEAESRMTAEAVDLYQQKITFGEFNKRRQALANETEPRWAAASQQARDSSQRAMAQQAEAKARWNAEMSELVQRFKPVTLTPVTRPTVTTNCSQIGNQVQCTTR